MEIDQIEKENNKEHSQIDTKTDNLLSNQMHSNTNKKTKESKQESPQDKKATDPKSPLSNSKETEAKNVQSKQKEAKVPKGKKKPSAKPKEVLPPNYKLIQSYKISNDSEKERKQYEDKVIAMKNRLKALKKQENDLQRKMNMMTNKEKELDIIKTEKETFKHALSSHKSERNKKMEDQKKKNVEEKIRVSSAVKNSMNESRSKKHAYFDLARNEKQIIVSLISENNEQLGSINQRRINQIKSEHTNFKSEEQRKQMEREEQLMKYYEEKREKEIKTTMRLKNQMAELEKLEGQYLESLQNTKVAEMKHSEMLKSNNTQKVLKLATETLSIRKLELDPNQKDKRAIRSKSTTTNGKDHDSTKANNYNTNTNNDTNKRSKNQIRSKNDNANSIDMAKIKDNKASKELKDI